MTVAVLYYHSSVIPSWKKTIIFCVSINNKNRNRPGIDAKQVKIASFFIKTGFSFPKKAWIAA